MAIKLILALKGTAAAVLESLCIDSREIYEVIIGALQRKYIAESIKRKFIK